MPIRVIDEDVDKLAIEMQAGRRASGIIDAPAAAGDAVGQNLDRHRACAARFVESDGASRRERTILHGAADSWSV